MSLGIKSSKLIPKWSSISYIIALTLAVLVIWAIGFSLFDETVVGVHSQLFQLVVLFIVAKLFGCLMIYLKVPPLVGMLLVGVLFRNTGLINITGSYLRFTAVLRQLALVNIMLPAGLGLDPQALKKSSVMIFILAIIPVMVEVLGITISTHFLMNFPWLWGVLVGFLLAAVSPAVIIPCLFELQALGYGVNKGIHTIVIAAATLNDIICIALFGVFIGIIFSTGSLLMQVMQGPIVLAIGFAFGIGWGTVCRFVPSNEDRYLVTLRTLLLGLGCILSALGSDAVGYGGAGALGCIVAAFVASLGWRKQGWGNMNPVRLNFALLWKFFEPISFSLIGIEVNFSGLKLDVVGWSILCMVVPLLLRIITSFACTLFSDLNMKENIFVAISWIPKASVQAALGPIALDLARITGNETLIQYGEAVVIVAVMAIIITSPIGAIVIMLLGPKFLYQTPPHDNPQVLGTEFENEEMNN